MARVTVTGKGRLPVDPLEHSGTTYRALYEYVLKMAQKEGAEEERQGVPGYLWEGSLRAVLADLYPGYQELDKALKLIGNQRARTANMAVAVRGTYGKGQKKETLWWVRAEWSNETVKLPQRKRNPDTAETSLETRQKLGTKLAASSAYGKNSENSTRQDENKLHSLEIENAKLQEAYGKLKYSCQDLTNENAELRGRILTLEEFEVKCIHLRSVIERFVMCADTTALVDLIIGSESGE